MGLLLIDTASGQAHRLKVFGRHLVWSPDGARLALGTHVVRFQRTTGLARPHRGRLSVEGTQGDGDRR
jgi:hypothetical protein